MLLILREMHLTELVAHIMQSSMATSAKIVPKELENLRVSLRLLVAEGMEHLEMVCVLLAATKEGPERHCPVPPPLDTCLMLSAPANFTVLLLWPWLPVWTQWGCNDMNVTCLI